MKMSRAAALLVAGTVGLGAAAVPASAIVIIDDFSSVSAPDPWPVMLNAEGFVDVNESGIGALGGTRHTHVEAVNVGIPGLDFLLVTVAAGAGVFDFNSTVDTDGFVSLLYDGGGSLNADLSGTSRIELTFTMFDYADSQSMPITVELSDGVNTASHTLSMTSPGGQVLAFNYADFAGIGSLDLSAIQSIRFDIDPGIGGDFRISQISAVPAPGALALLGLGLFASRRRRN